MAVRRIVAFACVFRHESVLFRFHDAAETWGVPHQRPDRPSKREAPLLAARQHGAIKASQLGLPSSTIADWVREGRLWRKYRGVYAYGQPHLSREGEWMAALLAAGDRAALAGMCSAARLKITKLEPEEIEVIVPGNRRQQAGFRLHTCRNLSPLDIVVVDRIPVTTVARTLVDLTDSKETEDLAFMIHEAAYLGKFSFPATRAAMQRANGRRNLDRLEAALQLHLSGSAGTRSRLEQRFRRLVRGAGLPAPRSNVEVNDFEVDFYWPGLCVEVDGPPHARPRTKVDDRIRDASLRAAGYVVLRFSEDDLNQRPAMVLAELAAQQLAASVAR
jgi:very-short-patch-repair endonuclease